MPRKKRKPKYPIDKVKKFDGKGYLLYRKTRSKDIADAQAHGMRITGYSARVTHHPKNKTFKYKVWIRKKK